LQTIIFTDKLKQKPLGNSWAEKIKNTVKDPVSSVKSLSSSFSYYLPIFGNYGEK